MIELIMVIVILGIVASIGSQVIVQIYESYIVQRAVHNASLKTELAVTQLANRLLYRIDASVVARVPGNIGFNVANDIVPLRNIQQAQANTHTALEWIGYDNDGFSTQGSAAQGNLPAWSGFVDLAASGANQITSTGSAFNAEAAILSNLFPGMQNPAIIFSTNNYRTNVGFGVPYAANCLHATDGTGCIFPVNIIANNILTFTGGGDRVANTMIYAEFYKLAGSAYAVVPVQTPVNGNDIQVTGQTINGTAVWDLRFFYDYQPWEGENYLTNAQNRSTLLTKVSVFRFTQETNSVRVKLCTIETIGTQDISICKEKAVIR